MQSGCSAYNVLVLPLGSAFSINIPWFLYFQAINQWLSYTWVLFSSQVAVLFSVMQSRLEQFV